MGLNTNDMADKQELTGWTCLMSAEQRGEVISRYEQLLEKYTTPVAREADLPFPKEMIRRAIRDELSENPDFEMRSYLEIAFVQLECFLSPEEFKVVHDFKRASALAQELAKSGDPRDIVASADILSKVKGDKAVRILEKISRKIRRRIAEIRAISLPVFKTTEY
jgi:hypothetical protein